MIISNLEPPAQGIYDGKRFTRPAIGSYEKSNNAFVGVGG